MATSGKSNGRFDAATRTAAGSVGMHGRKVVSGVRGAAGNVAGGQVTPLVRKGTAAATQRGRAASADAAAGVRRTSAGAATQGRAAVGRAAGGAVGVGRSVAGEAAKGATVVAGTGRSAVNKVASTGAGIGTGAVGAVGSVVASAVSAFMHAVVRAVVRAGLRAGFRFVADKALLLLQFIKRLALWLRGQVASLMQRLNVSTEGNAAPAH
jgi:hypothetical protein